MSSQTPKWDILSFLTQILNHQLTDFPTHEIFIFPSCLFFPFLHQNSKYFESIGMNMIDLLDLYLHVYEWNPIFIRKASNSNFTVFTNRVMKIAYVVIHGIYLPRIPREGK